MILNDDSHYTNLVKNTTKINQVVLYFLIFANVCSFILPIIDKSQIYSVYLQILRKDELLYFYLNK